MTASSFFPIELVPHDPRWIEVAARERSRLQGAIGDARVEVHHIGSTSIPSIRAKPIVDLIPLVTSLDALDQRKSAVEALGYEWRGEFGIPRRRYNVLVDAKTGKRVAQLHCFAADDPQVTRHLAFRDYLRAHDDEARAYELEKLRAQKLHPSDVNAYNDEKSAWIRACEQRALAWYGSRKP